MPGTPLQQKAKTKSMTTCENLSGIEIQAGGVIFFLCLFFTLYLHSLFSARSWMLTMWWTLSWTFQTCQTLHYLQMSRDPHATFRRRWVWSFSDLLHNYRTVFPFFPQTSFALLVRMKTVVILLSKFRRRKTLPFPNTVVSPETCKFRFYDDFSYIFHLEITGFDSNHFFNCSYLHWKSELFVMFSSPFFFYNSQSWTCCSRSKEHLGRFFWKGLSATTSSGKMYVKSKQCWFLQRCLQWHCQKVLDLRKRLLHGHQNTFTK